MLWDVFQAMKKHTSHVGLLSLGTVNQTFGKNSLNSVSAYPHIVWVPTTDEYVKPLAAALPQVIGGKEVHMESFMTRKCGCDLHVFHKDYASMETLLNDLHNALYDVAPALGTSANIGQLEVGVGQWVDREGQRDETVGYVQPINLYVPIYRLLPAAKIQNVTVTLP
jgi:hypothetical protein